MLQLLELAWRNMFRNKRRTFIAGTAIGIGLAALIFSDALIIGMKENMIRTATASFMGEGQIHAEGYLETREVTDTIRRPDTLLAHLREDERVRGLAPRLTTQAMISSPATVSPFVLWGIRPEQEAVVSQIDDALVRGDFFAGSEEGELVVGAELAELLEVDVGNRVVVTVAQVDGGLSRGLFRVSGVYRFNSKELDQGMAFVRIGEAGDMLGLRDGALHEIALTFTDDQIARDTTHSFWSTYGRYGNRAVGWPELIPRFAAMMGMTDLSMLLMGMVLFGVVALGIINTLFMSLYDRMFEFGVLRAVGTRPRRIWLLIVFEAGALAVISGALGVIAGFAVTLLFNQVGIDYRGIEFTGVTIQELIHPQLTIGQFTLYPLVVIALTLLVGMYPASYAARLKPAEAMRRSF
ncbi:MAG: FtsX-like permease family protein [Chitinivibrionales bacterium]|nr:FtsX-like permease family protein [Chitinivibrionales bacterium]MBD3359016.1 FtsX-like permease family protein [Chitinivibrionales bacterium]